VLLARPALRDAPRVTQRQALPVFLLAGCALLLAAAARIPLAFEDSYHHWLIAARFAETGRISDPLFGMEDTWLPGYHVVAGAILRFAGLWEIGSLRAFSAGCALLTLGLLFRLAGGGGTGVLAVLFVALNPIFLLTATSAVAEPLLTLCLVAATAAALADRRRLAALAALAACAVGTKAWLWLLLAACVQVLLVVGAKTPARSGRAVGWIVPALLLAVVIEAAIGAGGHSLSRAASEVTSAAARGSVGADPATRGLQFLGFFALASLPVVVLAPLGFVRDLHDPAARRRLAILHAPALLYLAAVAALVFLGIYTGSHRYLYPALPSLALLAATALRGVRMPARVGALVGALLVSVAFLPVLQSFGALDDGLVRAGEVAARVPGGLLTDSPVAAYWSGKRPSGIRGSRGLPANPDAAVDLLRSEGVGSLVLEDISYYGANAVFPGLAAGRGASPFAPIGNSADYSVAGGKAVSVYRLTSEPRFLRSAAGQGKTVSLARGAVLEVGGAGRGGEGVGFGVPLVRYPDGDWFAGTGVLSTPRAAGPGGWRTDFALDRRGVANDTAFAPVSSRGSVQVTYRVVGTDLEVSVRVAELLPGYSEFILLNEQSSAFDDYADASQTLRGPAVGSWTPVVGDWARFRSGALGIEWSMPRLPGAVGFHAAREVRSPDLDFSGLEYSFGPGFAGADYTIRVGEAR